MRAAAAAAAAAAAFGSAEGAGLFELLSTSLVSRSFLPPTVEGLEAAAGLRLRRAGERERRSKRDLRGGSGSVWSKRDRFLGSSAILTLQSWNILSLERGYRVLMQGLLWHLVISKP